MQIYTPEKSTENRDMSQLRKKRQASAKICSSNMKIPKTTSKHGVDGTGPEPVATHPASPGCTLMTNVYSPRTVPNQPSAAQSSDPVGSGPCQSTTNRFLAKDSTSLLA